jgi:hypothetical protein
MSEQNGDELTATGRHRAWVGEAASTVIRANVPPREAQRGWLERTKPTNSRHAAITRSLQSWSNYKSWTDKVRHGWDKEKK